MYKWENSSQLAVRLHWFLAFAWLLSCLKTARCACSTLTSQADSGVPLQNLLAVATLQLVNACSHSIVAAGILQGRW